MILTSTMGVGGAERILASLIEGLRARGFALVVCCLYDPGPLGDQLRAGGFDIVSNVLRSGRDLLGPIRLARVLRRWEVEVLYMNNQPATQLWGTVAATIARTPLVMTALHFTARDSAKNRRVNRLTRRGTDLWIAISEIQKRRLIDHEGVPARGRITVIPNGVDTERFAPDGAARSSARAELGIGDEVPVVGIVAGLRPDKNHSLFLRAAQRIHERLPDARFLVVGDGERRAELEREAETRGIADATLFLGIRADTPRLVNACDLGVLSSTFGVETSPVTLLEFMACEKPVVSTDVGAVREIVVDGENGLVVPEEDETALSEAILRLLEDEQLASRMGVAGRGHVAKRYSLDRMVARTEEEILDAWEQAR